MYFTNSNDCILQQAGLIQKGDINTGIPGSILRNAVLSQERQEYRPIWSCWNRKSPVSWATRMIQKLNFRNRQVIRKQTKKHYRPVSTISGN